MAHSSDTEWLDMDFADELKKRTTLDPWIKSLANHFWSSYQLDSEGAMQSLVRCLYKAGGFTVNYEIDCSISINIHQPNENGPDYESLISNNNFNRNFKTFLSYVLCHDSWQIFTNNRLIDRIVALTCSIGLSPWNSMRGASYIAGMKIFTESYKCTNFFNNSQHPQAETVKDISLKVRKCLLKDLFRRAMRDKEIHLRALPLLEVMNWFADIPFEILNPSFEKIYRYINRCLIDKQYIKLIALEVIDRIFNENSSLVENCDHYFNQSKSNILCNLVESDTLISVKSIQIITNAVRKFNCVLTHQEESIIFSCLYNNDDEISKEAKICISYIISNNLLKEELLLKVVLLYSGCQLFRPNWPFSMLWEHELHRLFRFYLQLKIKKPSRAILQLMDTLLPNLEWKHWLLAFENCPQNKKENCLELFFEFSQKVMSNNFMDHIPPSVLEMIRNLKACFTTQVSSDSILIDSINANLCNPKVLIYLMKIFELFNFSQLSTEMIPEIKDFILSLFFNEEDHSVLKESIDVLHKMQKECIIDIKFPYLVNIVIKAVTDSDAPIDFLCLTTTRVILVLKSLYVDTDHSWLALLDSLEYCEISKVQYITMIMYNILVHDKRYYIDQQNIPNPELLTQHEKRLYFRIQIFATHLQKCLHSDYSPLLQCKMSQVFSQIVVNFGMPNSGYYKTYNFGKMIENYEQAYMEHLAYLMQLDCSLASKECCKAIKCFGELMLRFRIHIEYLSDVFFHFGPENSHHSLLILQIMEEIIRKYPETINTYSKVILNGFIRLANKKMEMHEFTLENISEILQNKIAFLSTNSVILRRKLVYFYPYVDKLVKQGNQVFIGVSKFIESSSSPAVLEKFNNHLEELRT